MTKNNLKSKEGFTIIEVVLVLAIAGLIFLMVFIAFPGLQRGQRDTQRRNDMSRFLSQLSQYQTNNRGQVPTTGTEFKKFVANYLVMGSYDSTSNTYSDMKDTFNDPSTGEVYNIFSVTKCDSTKCDGSNEPTPKIDPSNSEFAGQGAIFIYTNATCQGEKPVYSQGDRKIAIRIKLEGAGVYCGNN